MIDLIGSGAISGKIAKDLFEIVYTEGGDPAQIVEARGMKQVTDTGAIEAAVEMMRDGDVVVIAGKGHEQGQIVAGVTHPFDDATVASEALSLYA